MRVILIDDDSNSMQALLELLGKKRIKAVAPLRSIQEGIETIEAQADSVSLTICNYRGGSPGLMKLFLQVSSSIPCVVFFDKEMKLEKLDQLPREAKLDFLDREDIPGFLRILDQYCEDGVLESRLDPDSDFLKLSLSNLSLEQLPQVDIYLRLAPNRYCRRFRKEDGVDIPELLNYAQKRGTSVVYLRKTAVEEWIQERSSQMDSFLEGSPKSPEQTRAVAEDNLEIVHNVVSQVGFTPKMEELAKKTVAITLKALGSSPRLSDILRKMQLQEGRYISSHSLMLAEIACALAHKMTWSSAPTFLKLTVASFLHDLSVPTNELARFRHPDQVSEANGFSNAEQKAFKGHPEAAAEYCRQLRQLPADVDTILLQHHERPDGSGFPRGLYHQQISPLASVFIVAEDLLDFFLASGTSREAMNRFIQEREQLYSAGNFKKIMESIKTVSAPDA